MAKKIENDVMIIGMGELDMDAKYVVLSDILRKYDLDLYYKMILKADYTLNQAEQITLDKALSEAIAHLVKHRPKEINHPAFTSVRQILGTPITLNLFTSEYDKMIMNLSNLKTMVEYNINNSKELLVYFTEDGLR